MPENCRFQGIIIRMFWETGEQHHVPHLHASYQGQTASYRLDTAEPLAGELPIRQHRYSLPGLNFIVTNFKTIGNVLLTKCA